jgi:diguanylate cyclase (GGDEF)-like protein
MLKKKSTIIGLVAFAAALVVATVIVVIYMTTASNSRKERARFLAESIGGNIAAEIDSREFISKILDIEIKNRGGVITEVEFNKLAEALFEEYIDVVDISIAPSGVVQYVYPKDSGLEKNMNFFDDELEGVYADYSKLSGTSVIIAPVTLIDGKTGVVIRKPVFMDDGSFWGFASVSLGLSDFLARVNIGLLAEEGYEYKLIGNNVITGEDTIITEYSEKTLNAPVEAMISTTEGAYWKLAISPITNWIMPHEALAVIVLALSFSILIALLANAYMALKANAKELEVLSYRDSLTNLYNPRSYQEHMEELTQKKLPYGIIYMDLNDFKMVNDTYGHETGDALLNIVAKRLQNSIREKDRAFRIGGDEFVVVIHGTHDKKFYEGVIARMRANVARDVVIGEVELKVSISAGYARCPEDGTRLEDVVKKADDAMYYNKRLLKAKRLSGQEKGTVTARNVR